MSIALQTITAPAQEPITLSEAKAHLRVDTGAEDSLIETLIRVARQHVEEVTSRALITQTLAYSVDDFLGSLYINHPWEEYLGYKDNSLILPRPPLQSVDNIEYVDTQGAMQTLDASIYRVDAVSEAARITEAEAETWPTTDSVTNAVTITYVAGYGDNPADVPAPLRHAMLMMIGHFYENREEAVVGTTARQLPMAVNALIAPYRVMF